MNEKELRKHYLGVFIICFEKMMERKNDSGYGTDEDLLKCIEQLKTQKLGVLIELKGIRISESDNICSMEDDAIDAINYSCEILRRL